MNPLSRPLTSSSALTDADRRWCQALHRRLQDAPFPSQPLFFATDAGPRAVAPDEPIDPTRT